MSIPIWIKSEYVTIGIALLFSSGGLSPSEKSEGKPPGSVVSHEGSIAYPSMSGNQFLTNFVLDDIFKLSYLFLFGSVKIYSQEQGSPAVMVWAVLRYF